MALSRATALSVLLVLTTAGSAVAQQKPISAKDFDRPGRELPEVTPGPGWKTCPHCQNEDQLSASIEKVGADRPAKPRDLSGIWSGGDAGGIDLDFKALPELTPYGRQMWEATQAGPNPIEPTPTNGGPGSKDPMLKCDPLGYPRLFAYNYGTEFVHLADRTLQFFEMGHTWRTIWTDGRQLPTDPPEQRFMGYAVGRWEANTFVIESMGYEPSTWIEQDRRKAPFSRGIPHSDEMRIVERWTRTSMQKMDVELAITDPKMFVSPWVTRAKAILHPSVELGEYICAPSMNDYLTVPPQPTR